MNGSSTSSSQSTLRWLVAAMITGCLLSDGGIAVLAATHHDRFATSRSPWVSMAVSVCLMAVAAIVAMSLRILGWLVVAGGAVLFELFWSDGGHVHGAYGSIDIATAVAVSLIIIVPPVRALLQARRG